MSSTATSTSTSKKPRMSLKQRVKYWQKRADVERRQLKLLEARKATLEKQITKQQTVITWAQEWADGAVTDLEAAYDDESSPYFGQGPDQNGREY